MKDFLLICDKNCATYKEVFPLFKQGIVSFGSPVKEYEGTDRKFGNHSWITTFPVPNKKKLVLTATYSPALYPKYDNYDAIEVSRIKNIPYDYDGVMGVPITILDYDLDNVEVLWTASGHSKNTMPKDIANSLSADFVMKSKSGTGNGYAILNGTQLYHRILIKKNFEIVGATQRGCHNELPDTKKYDNYLEITQEGTFTGSGGGKTNENANVVGKPNKGNYFIDNNGRTIYSLYQRIFIRRKK